MADLTITAANVVSGSGATTEAGTAGATITAGQPVYRAASGKYVQSDSDSGTAAARSVRGIALHGASDNQPLMIHRSGPLTIGATLTAGATYWLSNTAGGICPDADVGTGEYAVLIGTATSTTVLNVDIQETGVQR